MVDKNCKKLRYSSCCFIKLEQIPSVNLDLICWLEDILH